VGRQAIRLGGPQFWLTILVLVSVTVILIAVWWPAIAREYQESVVLPGYESEFGFKGGRVTVQTTSGSTYQVYAIVSVIPQGRMDRAGFKPGDVPLGHHGGTNDLCLALYRARRGEVESIWVRRASDGTNSDPRKITIR
jgi:hypothetical protein